MFNCLLQEKSYKGPDAKKILFNKIRQTLNQTIVEQYNDVNDDLNEIKLDKENEGDLKEELYAQQRKEHHIDHEELLRIHYYFDEIVIEGILDELMSLIGEKEISDIKTEQKDRKDGESLKTL